MSFTGFWITYAACGGAIVLALLVWAIRNRQFTEFERQSRLALDAEPAVEDAPKRAASRFDTLSVLGVPAFALAVIAAVLWVAVRSR